MKTKRTIFITIIFLMIETTVFSQVLWTWNSTVGNNTTNTNVGIGISAPRVLLEVRDGNFILSDIDVVHGMTTWQYEYTYGSFSPYSATAGGLNVTGVSDDDLTGLVLTSAIGTNTPTATTPAIKITGAKKNVAGTGITALATTETLLQVQNNGTALTTILGSGYVGIGTTTPSQQLEITKNFSLPVTTGSTVGVIYSGAERYIHNYGDYNFFAGVDAGNFSMTGDYNVGIGVRALQASSSGSYNTANGYQALYSNETAGDNTAVGYNALYSQSFNNGNTAWNSYNVAIGNYALYSNQPTLTVNGINNTAVGYMALYENITGYNNTANGFQALYFNEGGIGNTALGYQSGYKNDGGYNTFIGYLAGYNNWSSPNNVAVGANALYKQGTGHVIVDGSNVAVGTRALYSTDPTNASDGISNIGVGHSALHDNTVGKDNTAVGYDALYSNVTGSQATAIGRRAMYLANNTQTPFDNYNVAVGYESLMGSANAQDNTGNYNTAVGYQSLNLSKKGGANTAVGYQSLFNNSNAEHNTAIGFNALYTQSYDGGGSAWSSYNVAVGGYALYSNQPTSTNSGINNTAIGYDALRSNITGNSNTASGFKALTSNQSGDENTAVGFKALYTGTQLKACTAVGAYTLFTNAIGEYNIAVGQKALYYNYSGHYNTATGDDALYKNDEGDANTAVGPSALYANEDGSDNIAIGAEALNSNTIGNYNTVVGNSAGQAISGTPYSTCSFNTCLGYEANTINGYSNCMALGYGAVSATSQNNSIEIGNTSISLFHGENAYTYTSDRRIKKNISENVPGLAFINLLKPVTYYKDIHIENSIKGYPTKTTIIPEVLDSAGNVITPSSAITTIDTTFWPSKYDIEHILYTGLIAQQVDSAAQQIGYDFSGIHRPQGTNDLYALGYDQFVAPLIVAVQELYKSNDSLKKQQSISDSLYTAQINNLITMITNCCIFEQTQKSMQNFQDQNSNEDTIHIQLANNDQIILYQNEPNPFDNYTVIRYYIPENTLGEASVVFNDMYGNEIKKEEITVKGLNNIKANTDNLASGIYSYSLYVDGKLIDTKKMIRNK
jgi:trimeric autotransporter adhesin